MTSPAPLIDGYTWRELDDDAFAVVFDRLRPAVFDRLVEFPFWALADDDARAARERLQHRLRDRLRVHLVALQGDEVIGWTTGVQETGDRYAMSNSAVLEAHRGRGIYTALLRTLLDRLRSAGFQTVVSHHHPTNTAVLVPKLKTGFAISGFEITDLFGTLVRLSYHFDPIRRDALAFRAGAQTPHPSVLRSMGLSRASESESPST